MARNQSHFQLRRDTSENWEAANPVLKAGEPGFVLDLKQLKIGDGVTPWNDLEYLSGAANGAGGKDQMDRLKQFLEEYYDYKSEFVDDEITTIKNYAFFNDAPAKVSCANVTEIGGAAFMNFAFYPMVNVSNDTYLPVNSQWQDADFGYMPASYIFTPYPSVIGQGSIHTDKKTYEYYNPLMQTCSPLSEIDLMFTNDYLLIDALPVSNLYSISFPKCETIKPFAFFGQNNSQFSSVNMPKAKGIGTKAFASCYFLQTAIFPEASVIGYGAFQFCNLINLSFPEATTICSYAFYRGLGSSETPVDIVFPKVTYIGEYAFSSNTYNGNFIFPKCQTIETTSFEGLRGSNINLILGGSEVCELTGWNDLSTSFNNIYVRQSLVSNYQNMSEWSNESFLAIEGTEYEQYIQEDNE